MKNRIVTCITIILLLNSCFINRGLIRLKYLIHKKEINELINLVDTLKKETSFDVLAINPNYRNSYKKDDPDSICIHVVFHFGKYKTGYLFSKKNYNLISTFKDSNSELLYNRLTRNNTIGRLLKTSTLIKHCIQVDESAICIDYSNAALFSNNSRGIIIPFTGCKDKLSIERRLSPNIYIGIFTLLY